MKDMTTLQKRLHCLRWEKGIKIQDLAKQVGVSASAISGYETGRRTPSVDVLHKIAKALGVTVDFFLGDEQHEHAG